MLVYSTMLFLSTFFLYLAEKKVFSYRQLLIFLSFLFTFLVSAFRYNVGTDYPAYRIIFIGIDLNNYEYLESGYRWLNLLIKAFTSNPQWIFVFTSLIILATTFKGIYILSPNKPLSVFLFITMGFYFYSFNGIRQYIAISLVLYAGKYLKSGNFKKFAFIIIIASLFHKSVLSMIIAYFILRIKPSFKYYFLVFLTSFLCLINYKTIQNIIFTYFYNSYLNSNILEDFHLSVFNILLSLALVIASVVYYPKLISRHRFNYIFLNIAFYTLDMFLFLGSFGIFVSRMAAYFSIYFIIFIPEIIACENDFQKRSLLSLFTYTTFLIFFYLMLDKNNQAASMLLPYQTIFNAY